MLELGGVGREVGPCGTPSLKPELFEAYVSCDVAVMAAAPVTRSSSETLSAGDMGVKESRRGADPSVFYQQIRGRVTEASLE